jgi:hypothetical protein
MSKPRPDLELLRLLNAFRPRNYQITLIARDGSTTNSPKFATRAEAREWAVAHTDVGRDVVMTHFSASHERN